MPAGRYRFGWLSIVVWLLVNPVGSFAQDASSLDSSKDRVFQLLNGKSQTVHLRTTADRINIGTKGIVSLFMTDENTLSITAKKPGYTTVTVQYSDGKIEQFGVRVAAASSPVVESLVKQLKGYLEHIPGIEVQQSEDKVLITGKAAKEYEGYYQQTIGMYKEVIIDQVIFGAKDDTYEQLKKYFSAIPEIIIKRVEDRFILSGAVHPVHKDYYHQVIALFKDKIIDQVQFGGSDDPEMQLKKYLAAIPGIQIRSIKDKVIISGNVDMGHKNYYRQVVEMFKGTVIDAVTFPGEDDAFRQLKKLFAATPTIEIKEIEGKVILSGSVESKDLEFYRQVIEPFQGKVINLVKLPEENDSIQVDAQVVEVTQNGTDDLGIEWFAAGPWQVTATGTGSAATSGAGSGGSSSDSSSGSSGTSSSSSGGASSGSAAPGLTASGQLNLQQVTFNLIALMKDGKARFLATPKLTVQSGKKASFQVGGELPIAQITANSSSVEWKKFGTQLEIAPVLAGEDSVFITITATVSQFDFSRLVQGNPTLLSKVASTNLKVKDRESFAIAGLLSNEENETISKVPILGDIPLVGYIFKRKTKTLTKTETLVLFTPYILKRKQEQDNAVKSLIKPGPALEKAKQKLLLDD